MSRRLSQLSGREKRPTGEGIEKGEEGAGLGEEGPRCQDEWGGEEGGS